MSKILVAYFSPTRHTAKLATNLSKVINGDLYEIKPLKMYSASDLDWTDKNSRSSKEMQDKTSRPTIITADLPNMQEYSVVFVGFPIWWYIAPTIVNTFLETCDLSGKTVVPFASSGGSGMGKTNDYLRPSCKGAILKEGKVFSPSVSGNELKKWAENKF